MAKIKKQRRKDKKLAKSCAHLNRKKGQTYCLGEKSYYKEFCKDCGLSRRLTIFKSGKHQHSKWFRDEDKD